MDKATQTETEPDNDNNDKTLDKHTTDYDEQETEPDTQKQFNIPRFPYQSNKNFYKDRVYACFNMSLKLNMIYY